LAEDRIEALLWRLRGSDIVTERCGYCHFTVSAPLEEARAAF